jgi:hypothetical protein
MIDQTAARRWKRLNIAMAHFQSYILNKTSKYDLTIIDLLFVSNFKGGNASITEPAATISDKLREYSLHLERMNRCIAGRTLVQFEDANFEEVKTLACDVLKLTAKRSNFQISGFGPSYASALLSGYFPDVVPVIDRRVLNGARIEVELDSQQQVKDMAQHFQVLFDRCREMLFSELMTLREVDMHWFVQPFPKEPADRAN